MNNDIDFVVIECRTDCPECGGTLMLNGPAQKVHCGKCQSNVDITDTLWNSILEDIPGELKELENGEGRQSQMWAEMNVSLTYTRQAPECSACKAELSSLPDPDSISEGATLPCPKCGEANTVRPAPEWLRFFVPELVLLVNAAGDVEPDDEQDKTPSGKPVILTCPACAGALKVDGTQRMIDCEFCESSIYLPDDLWLRLHPVKTIERWFAGFALKAADIKARSNVRDFIMAVREDNLEDVESCLKRGVSIDATDANLRSGLFFAAAFDHFEIATLLVERKARVDSADNTGTTALLIAAYNGHRKISEYLLKHGADINARNKQGMTPLAGAARKGREEVVRLLVAEGADLDVPNEDGKTALIRAGEEGHDEVVEILKRAAAGVRDPVESALSDPSPEEPAFFDEPASDEGRPTKPPWWKFWG